MEPNSHPAGLAEEQDNDPGANALHGYGKVISRLSDGRTDEQVLGIVDISNPSLTAGVSSRGFLGRGKGEGKLGEEGLIWAQ